MTEHATLAIELTDDELLAVSGGSTHITVGISQRNRASAGIAQFGGDVIIGGGGSGATSNSGNVSVSESFSASISQTQTNSNTGNVTGTIASS
jgi:hypothetical protein